MRLEIVGKVSNYNYYKFLRLLKGGMAFEQGSKKGLFR